MQAGGRHGDTGHASVPAEDRGEALRDVER
jgi:hypothetical protein